MYPDGDYLKDWDRTSIASFPAGIAEEERFLPIDSPPVRRTNSCDDVSRFHRYFSHLKRHLGKRFTWYRYTRILHDEIRDFETPEVPLMHSKPNPQSEMSIYVTASSSHTVATQPTLRKRRFKLGSITSIFSTTPEPSCSSSVTSTTNTTFNDRDQIITESKNLTLELLKKMNKLSKFHKSPKAKTRPSRPKRHLKTAGDSPAISVCSSKIIQKNSPSISYRIEQLRIAGLKTDSSCDSCSPAISPSLGAGESPIRRRHLKKK